MIDDTDNIANQAIYIWSGKKDDVVHPKGQKAQYRLYKSYDVENLTFKKCKNCDHGWDDDSYAYQTGFKTIYEQLGYITDWADDATDEEVESLGTL